MHRNAIPFKPKSFQISCDSLSKVSNFRLSKTFAYFLLHLKSEYSTFQSPQKYQKYNINLYAGSHSIKIEICIQKRNELWKLYLQTRKQ